MKPTAPTADAVAVLARASTVYRGYDAALAASYLTAAEAGWAYLQAHPQNIVKYAIRKLGYEQQAKNYVHVAYGMVRLPEGKFSGRAGTWVGFSADDLMQEGLEKTEERMKEASLIDRKRIVNAAIKYSFLKVGASKEVTFDWERAWTPAEKIARSQTEYVAPQPMKCPDLIESMLRQPSPGCGSEDQNIRAHSPEVLDHQLKYGE